MTLNTGSTGSDPILGNAFSRGPTLSNDCGMIFARCVHVGLSILSEGILVRQIFSLLDMSG
eukprot:SAG11_NODE_360_length_10188_cov_25.643671_6_plen_61_part_00